MAAYLPTYTGNIGQLSFVDANTSGVLAGPGGSYLKLFGALDTRLGSDQGTVELWSHSNVQIRTNIDGINRPNMLKATTEMKNGECES